MSLRLFLPLALFVLLASPWALVAPSYISNTAIPSPPSILPSTSTDGFCSAGGWSEVGMGDQIKVGNWLVKIGNVQASASSTSANLEVFDENGKSLGVNTVYAGQDLQVVRPSDGNSITIQLNSVSGAATSSSGKVVIYGRAPNCVNAFADSSLNTPLVPASNSAAATSAIAVPATNAPIIPTAPVPTGPTPSPAPTVPAPASTNPSPVPTGSAPAPASQTVNAPAPASVPSPPSIPAPPVFPPASGAGAPAQNTPTGSAAPSTGSSNAPTVANPSPAPSSPPTSSTPPSGSSSSQSGHASSTNANSPPVAGTGTQAVESTSSQSGASSIPSSSDAAQYSTLSAAKAGTTAPVSPSSNLPWWMAPAIVAALGAFFMGVMVFYYRPPTLLGTMSSQEAVMAPPIYLSDSRLSLMRELEYTERIPTDIAIRLEKSKSTVVEQLDELCTLGLVERLAQPGKKFVFYRLSRTGKQALLQQAARNQEPSAPMPI